MTLWIIAEWPDGTWCNQDEIQSYLEFMSDDYELRKVLTWDGAYTPMETEPWTPDS